MNKLLVSLGLAFSILMMASCGGSDESKLIGIWKVTKVETDFDENRVTPEMLSQVVDMQKQTYFRILNDSAMVIISGSNTHEANWNLNPADESISYFFKGMESQLNSLGKISGDQIISESKTAMGMMTIIYEKEKD